MESMLSKIKKLKFLNKRLCGIWLIWIGFIIFLGTLLGGNYLINPFMFSVGYALGYFFIFAHHFSENIFLMENIQNFKQRRPSFL
nr:DUF6609 family protein [Clostridium felsineum]